MKRPNYNAAKRARELKQKAKRDAKLARRQSRGTTPDQADQQSGVAAPNPEPIAESPQDPQAPSGT